MSVAAEPGDTRVQAAQATLAVEMAPLFALDRKPMAEALNEAHERYRKLQALAPNDDRIDYGYGLALLRLRRPDEAVDVLSRVAELRPTDLAVRQATICAILSQPKPGEVLGEMTSLAGAVGAAAPQGNAGNAATNQNAQHDRLNAATFLGQVVGYLEGPRTGIVEPAELDAFAEKARRQLARPERIAFAVGRKKVADQFAALRAESDALRSAAKAKERQQRERDLQKVARGTQEQAAERHMLDAKEKKLGDDAVQLDQVVARMATLEERRQLLDDRAAVVQGARDLLIVNYQAAPGATPLDRRGQYLALVATTRDLDYQIAELNVAARELMAEQSVLEGRRQALLLEGGLESPKIGKQEATLTSQQKKTRALEGKARQTHIAGHTSQVQSLAVQAIRWQTYLDFSLDAEQRRLLDSFRAAAKQD